MDNSFTLFSNGTVLLTTHPFQITDPNPDQPHLAVQFDPAEALECGLAG
jgi:hypothetical protein